MMSANINVLFSKNHSVLTLNGQIIAQRPKVDNLFIYTASLIPKDTLNAAYYSMAPANIILWHHQLAHTGYLTLEVMKRLCIADRFMPNVHHSPITQCTDFPYGKQMCTPFQKTELLPANISDVIVSDLCGPFETSVRGFKYFVTWIDSAT